MKSAGLFMGIPLALAVVWLHELPSQAETYQPAAPTTRSFVFTYEVGVRNVDSGERVEVWLPIWTPTPYQKLHRLQIDAADADVLVEPKYGNRLLHVVATGTGSSEQTVATVQMTVTRHEVKAPVSPLGEYVAAYADRSNVRPVPLSAKERALFLGPNRLVPVGGPAVRLINTSTLPVHRLQLAKQLYDIVLGHMTYKKEGTGWGQGDVNWACQAGYGNCTDFHSLFISLARYYGIPAKFVIGFPLPETRGSGIIPGYHCWAYFYVEEIGWIPVDISEADKRPELAGYYFGNLTADRIALSTGRDLALTPEHRDRPLNYLIYPYARIDGKEASRDQLWWRVSYRDIEQREN